MALAPQADFSIRRPVPDFCFNAALIEVKHPIGQVVINKKSVLPFEIDTRDPFTDSKHFAVFVHRSTVPVKGPLEIRFKPLELGFPLL